MTRIPVQTASKLEQLAGRLRQLVLDTQHNYGSGVQRFKVTIVAPLTLTELGGELVLEDGDPDFTVGEALRARAVAAQVASGDLVWVAREGQEWHAFDVVSR